MKKIRKNLTLLTFSSLLLVSLVILKWPDDYTRVIFCDVGQGDAIIIQKGFKQILIDSGGNNNVINCLNSHLPFWDRKIEMIVLSHADNDHLGGFDDVLEQFFVNEAVIGELGKKTSGFYAFKELLLREEKQGMNLSLLNGVLNHKIDDGVTFKSIITRVGDVPKGVYNSQIPEAELWDKIDEQNAWMKLNKTDINTLSVANILRVENVTFLFIGDLDIKGEQALIRTGLIEDIDVLKIGHHGSKTSTGDELLYITQPEISVISVGKNNSYRHPHPQVLAKLNEFKSKILRTDQLGDIIVVTDGKKYWIE